MKQPQPQRQTKTHTSRVKLPPLVRSPRISDEHVLRRKKRTQRRLNESFNREDSLSPAQLQVIFWLQDVSDSPEVYLDF